VNFPAKEITPWASTKLYCLVTEAHRCSVVSDAIYRRKIRFLIKLKQSDDLLCMLFATNTADEIIVEQSHCL